MPCCLKCGKSSSVPLDKFIAGTVVALGTDAEEVLVEEAKIYRNNAGPNEHAHVFQLNNCLVNEFSA